MLQLAQDMKGFIPIKVIGLLSAMILAGFISILVHAPAAEAAGCVHTTTTTSCVEDDGTYYWVANDKIWVQVKKTTGYVVQIHNKTTNLNSKSTTTGAWPLGIKTGSTTDRATWKAADLTNATASAVTTPTITNGTGTAQLQLAYSGANYKYNDGTATGIALTVHINIADGQEYVRLSADVNNNGGSNPIRSIYFANGGDLTATASGGTVAGEYLALPKWEGGFTYANPAGNASFANGCTSATAFPCGVTLGYPGWNNDTLTMGWMDLYNANSGGSTAGGIGIAYINKKKMAMEFRVQKQFGATGLTMEPVLFDPSGILTENQNEYNAYHVGGDPNYSNITLIPGVSIPNGAVANNSFSTDDVIVAPHSGDWHAMADIYRTEYQKAFVDGSGNPDYLTWNGTPGVTGSAVSAKAKAIDEVNSVMVGLESTTYALFQSLPDSMQASLDYYYKTTNASGSHVALWMGGENEHGGYAADVPVQMPALDSAGGTSALTAALTALHVKGAASYLYNHPYAWDTQNSEYTRSGSPIPAADPNQHNEYWNGIWHHAICPNSTAVQSFWQNTVIPSMRATGMDGMQFDQAPLEDTICNLAGYPQDAVSRLQSHIAGVDSLMTMVRNNLITGGGAFVMGESGNDLQARHMDIWSLGLNYTGPQEWNGIPTPEIDSYSAPQYIRQYSPNTADLLMIVANGGIAEIREGTPLVQEYVRLKQALRDAAAPGYPYGFRDRDGLSVGNASIVARAFRDTDKQQGTIVYYNSSATSTVTTTITVNLATLGIGTGSKTFSVSLAPQTGAFTVIDSFDHDTVGAAAPGWTNGAGTNLWKIANESGNLTYQQTDAATSSLHSTIMNGSTMEDSLLSAKFKFNTSNAGRSLSLLARYSDSSNYIRMFIDPTDWGLQTQRGGVFNNVAGVTGVTFATGTWYDVKLQVVDGIISGKVWQDGTTEPASWQLTQDINQTAPLDRGKTGLLVQNTSASFDDVIVSSLSPTASLLNDAFSWDPTGANAPGWAVATGTSTWQAAVESSNIDYQQTDTSASALHAATTGSGSWTDVSMTAKFKFNTSNTGRSISILGRYTDMSNYVRLFADATDWGLQYQSGGVFSSVTTLSGLSFAPGTWYDVKYQIIGGVVSAKVWQDGTAEPASWQLTQQFNQSGALAAGKVGLVTANTSASFDNLAVTGAGSTPVLLNDNFFDLTGAGAAAPGWTAVSGSWTPVVDGSDLAYQGKTTASVPYARSVTGSNWDHTVVTARMKFTSTDANRELDVLTRYTPSGDAYGNMARLVCNATDCAVQTHINGAWGTPVGLPGVTLTPNTWYRTRVEAVNGIIRAKIWADGAAEPVDWQASTTFAYDPPMRKGQVGFAVGNAASGSTVITAEFDDLIVNNQVIATDFENGTAGSAYPGWVSPGGDAGTWRIAQPGGAGTNKEYKQTNEFTPAGVMSISYENGLKWGDALVQTRVKFNHADANREISVLARYVDGNNFARLVILNNVWAVQLRVGGVWISGPSVSVPSGFAIGTWYRVKFAVSGGTVVGKVWQDGTQEPFWQASMQFDQYTLTSGYVGFASAGTDPSFDDLTVDSGAQPENVMLLETFDVNAVGASAVGWAPNGGTWTIVDEYSNGDRTYKQTNAAAGFATTSTGDSSWTDIVTVNRFKFDSSNPSRDASILVRYTDDNNFARVSCLSSGCYLQTRIGGTWSSPTSLGVAAPTVGIYYKVKVRVAGSTLSAKVWKEGTAEPGAWQANLTFSGLASGKVAFMTANTDAQFDYLTVALK